MEGGPCVSEPREEERALLEISQECGRGENSRVRSLVGELGFVGMNQDDFPFPKGGGVFIVVERGFGPAP